MRVDFNIRVRGLEFILAPICKERGREDSEIRTDAPFSASDPLAQQSTTCISLSSSCHLKERKKEGLRRRAGDSFGELSFGQ